MSTIEIFKSFLDILIVPMFGLIWNVQGRISKIEGKLDVVLTETDRRKTPR